MPAHDAKAFCRRVKPRRTMRKHFAGLQSPGARYEGILQGVIYKKKNMNFLLHRRITICMLFIALTMLGYVSYKQLPVELLPNAELPMLAIPEERA